MAFRYVHPDGPAFGHCIEVSSDEYETVKRALYTALERADRIGASADNHDLTTLLSELEPLEDDR